MQVPAPVAFYIRSFAACGQAKTLPAGRSDNRSQLHPDAKAVDPKKCPTTLARYTRLQKLPSYLSKKENQGCLTRIMKRSNRVCQFTRGKKKTLMRFLFLAQAAGDATSAMLKVCIDPLPTPLSIPISNCRCWVLRRARRDFRESIKRDYNWIFLPYFRLILHARTCPSHAILTSDAFCPLTS